MRLIDIDAPELYKKAYTPQDWSGIDYYPTMIEWETLMDAPIIDAVPVVRCKDCRFAFQNNGHDKEGCPIMDRRAWMNGNSFCSEGKPMDKKEATK